MTVVVRRLVRGVASSVLVLVLEWPYPEKRWGGSNKEEIKKDQRRKAAELTPLDKRAEWWQTGLDWFDSARTGNKNTRKNRHPAGHREVVLLLEGEAPVVEAVAQQKGRERPEAVCGPRNDD